MDIEGGVRLERILFRLTFNVCTERIITEAPTGKKQENLTIKGTPINNLQYADDTVLIAASIEALQKMLRREAP